MDEEEALTIKKIWSVEWSPSQRCLHVQSVEKMLEKNLGILLEDGMSDYITIGIFEDETKMEAFLQEVRGIIQS